MDLKFANFGNNIPTFCAVSSLKTGCADTLITPLTVVTCRIILTWVVVTFVNV